MKVIGCNGLLMASHRVVTVARGWKSMASNDQPELHLIGPCPSIVMWHVQVMWHCAVHMCPAPGGCCVCAFVFYIGISND